jgi:hypothetical protein
MLLALALVLAAPTFDAFDEPLDPARWYVGTDRDPAKGALRLRKSGWIVSRGIPDDEIERVEIVFRHKGGDLEVTFHDAREPLTSPQGDPLHVKRGKGERRLVVGKDGATLDGAPLPWKGDLRGTFKLHAVRGDVELLEVAVEPRAGEPRDLTAIERATVHFATTPQRYRAKGEPYRRVTMMLWDVEVCFLLRHGPAEFELLRAPPKGAPVLGALVTAGEARDWWRKASGNALAMADWGDEKRHLSPGEFALYLDGEFAVYALLQHAQRALNAAVPDRDDLEPLVHLAMIRHTPNAHSAVGLAEVQGAKAAVTALRKALGKGVDIRRAGPDKVRQAAADAARAILGEPPPQWPGFRFDPSNRFVTIQTAKDLVR